MQEPHGAGRQVAGGRCRGAGARGQALQEARYRRKRHSSHGSNDETGRVTGLHGGDSAEPGCLAQPGPSSTAMLWDGQADAAPDTM